MSQLQGWVDSIQASGRYSFLRKEAAAALPVSPNALAHSLLRLAKKKRIAKIRDDFYVIVPMEYRDAGAPPPSWFIQSLMDAMSRPYYVGLLSAAAQFGAAHQQPQEFQVITSKPFAMLRAGRSRIRFYVKKRLEKAAIEQTKTPTGYMRVSTPEQTVVDLVRFAKAAGYLSNVATVIKELAPKLDAKRLRQVACHNGLVASVQRLGYILETIGERKLAKPLSEWIGKRTIFPVPLRSNGQRKAMPENARWKIIINDQVEAEA